jgi:hypothetical protein
VLALCLKKKWLKVKKKFEGLDNFQKPRNRVNTEYFRQVTFLYKKYKNPQERLTDVSI